MTNLNLTKSTAVSAVLAACLLPISAAAQSPFAKALPADTIAFVSFPDIHRSIADMENAPLAKMWHEAEVQDFVADAMAMVEARFNEALDQAKAEHEAGNLPVDPAQVMDLDLASLSIALTSLDLQRVEGQVMPKFGILLHADLGQSAPIWEELLNTLLDRVGEQAGDDLAVTTWTAGDARARTIGVAEIELPMSLNIAFQGSSLVIGSIEHEVKAFCAALATGESNLAATANYTAASQHTMADGVAVEAYFRVSPLADFAISALNMAKADGELPPAVDIDGVERAITALGLRSIGAISGSSSYADGHCVSESFMACPADKRVGLTAMNAGDADMGLLKWVPKDAASVSLGKLDFVQFYDVFVGAVQAYDQGTSEMLLGRLSGMEEQFGVSVRNDLFGALKGDFVWWQLPMTAFNAAPQMAIIAELQNEEGFLKALKVLERESDGMISLEENERRGIKVYQLYFDVDVGNQMGINPFAAYTPTFTFHDDHLVLAFSTGDIKRALKRMQREDDPAGDIRSNSEFAPYLQQMPSSGVTSLSFRDWKAEFESYYQIGTTVLAFLPLDADIPIDLSLLPDSSTLTQHLCGAVTWTRVTDDGVATTSIGPWGPETMALLVGGIAAGSGFMAATRVRGDTGGGW